MFDAIRYWYDWDSLAWGRTPPDKCVAEVREWFKDDIKKEDNKVEKKEKLTGYTRVAGVMFKDYTEKVYYYALYDEDVAVGSQVMVTGRGAGKIVDVVGVYTVDEFANKRVGIAIHEEICAVVDDSKYQERKAKRERVAELRKKMDEAIARVDEDKKYARYAEIDGEVGDLFKQYCELMDS